MILILQCYRYAYVQIKDGKAYRCKLCDFDMCLRCFAKKDKLTMEGVLRGDKGVRQVRCRANCIVS